MNRQEFWDMAFLTAMEGLVSKRLSADTEELTSKSAQIADAMLAGRDRKMNDVKDIETALLFYAEPSNYEAHPGSLAKVTVDRGWRARTALDLEAKETP